MSFVFAVEKLGQAARDLVGVGTIQERLGKAYGPLSVLEDIAVGKLAALGNRAALVVKFDGVMAGFSAGAAEMPDAEAGMLAASVLDLYEEVLSASE